MTPLSENIPDIAKNGISFGWLANVLASDYQSVYVIDSSNDGYVEYAPSGVDNDLEIRSFGDDFYGDVTFNCPLLVYPDDRDKFLRVFKKENVLAALRSGRSFHLDYRLINDGETLWCHLKTIRGKGIDNGFILVGVQIVNEPEEDYCGDVLDELEGAGLASSFSKIYESIYAADMKSRRFRLVSSKRPKDDRVFPDEGSDVCSALEAFAGEFVHPDDREAFLFALDAERIEAELASKGTASASYRVRAGSGYRCRELTAFARSNAPDRIVAAVRNSAAAAAAYVKSEGNGDSFDKAASSLAKRCDSLFIVDLVTSEYKEYTNERTSSSPVFNSQGTDFFKDFRDRIKRSVFADDVPMMLEAFSKERFAAALEETGDMALTYKRMIKDVPRFVTLFAIRSSDDPRRAVIAVVNVDGAVRREISFRKAHGNAMENSDRDRLTRVRNKNAFVQNAAELNDLIKKGEAPPFAVAVSNVNGLKVVNDALGREAGDEYIKSACAVVCEIFSHSPVFRVGADEFAVIVKGRDYEARGELMERFRSIMNENIRERSVTAAIGCSDFDPEKDVRVRDVFQRANSRMHENKQAMKLIISGAEEI